MTAPVVIDDFDLFWEAYPRKTAKGYARKIFAKALTKTTALTIMQALAAQKLAGMFSPDAKFVPHPSTWLAQDRWDDAVVSTRPTFRNGALEALARSMERGPMLEHHGDD
jgi:hypothetical protein